MRTPNLYDEGRGTDSSEPCEVLDHLVELVLRDVPHDGLTREGIVNGESFHAYIIARGLVNVKRCA